MIQAMIKDYLKELCINKDAKGTSKQIILSGNWIKQENIEIPNHNQKSSNY